MAYRQASTFVPQYVDANGVPLNSGTISAFLAGTTTATPMYSDIDGTAAGSIITLNARGEPEVSGNTIMIWLDTALSYKFVLKDAAGASIWTVDDITVATIGGDTGSSDGSGYYRSVASMVADIDLQVDDVVETLGYYTPEDRGNNRYRIITGGVYTADGGEIIDLTNGLQAVGMFPDRHVHIEQFGIANSNDNNALSAAVDYCISHNIRYLNVDSDIVVTDVPDDFYNVIMVGNGSISGAYRRWVYPQRSFNKTTGYFVPAIHLPQFITTGLGMSNPKVVFFGDSFLTYNVGALGRQNTIASMIEKKFANEYPDLTIDFVNRAIGGQSWNQALTVATTTTEDWYTDPMVDWIDYVEAETPDVVVVCFGMNAPSSYDPDLLTDFVAHVEAWTPAPDIIFITNAVPTLEAHPDNAVYSTEAQQEYRDNVAGHVRTYCLSEGYGFIDVNRVNNIVRDGFDCFETHLERIETELDISDTGSYLSDIQGFGYKFAGLIEGTSGEIADVFDGTNGVLAAYTGDSGNGPCVVFIRDLGASVFVLDFYDGVSGSYYLRVTTTEAIPTSDFTLYLECAPGLFLMRIQEGATERDIVRLNDHRAMGGQFAPVFGYTASSYVAGPFSEMTLDIAMPELYLPTLTNDEVWGVGESTGSTKLPYGGNGINHPTSLGASAIFGKALNDVKFR